MTDSPRVGRVAVVMATLALAASPQERWTAPKDEAARVNPLPASDAALQKGRAVYQKNCASCHGVKGQGDGAAISFLAERTSRRPKDLSDAKLQASLSDGEIFWKVSTGFKEGEVVVMPEYATEIKKEEDRWALVHFVRTLAGRD